MKWWWILVLVCGGCAPLMSPEEYESWRRENAERERDRLDRNERAMRTAAPANRCGPPALGPRRTRTYWDSLHREWVTEEQ